MLVSSRQFSLSWPLLTSFRMNLFHLLRDYAVSETQIDETGLVFTEYLTNLLKHANGEGEAVCFDVALNAPYLTLSLQDKTPFNYVLARAQAKHDDSFSPKALRESGMGIELIQQLFSDFSYQQQNGINVFSIKVKAHTRRPTVMLIDDAQSTLTLLTAYLQEDFSVSAYADPLVALNALLHEPPDVIIVDIHMPGLSGEQLIRKVQQHEKLKRTKIVVLTGDINGPQAIQANVLGIDAMLAKPTSKVELHRVLSMLLSRNVMPEVTAKPIANHTANNCGPLRYCALGSVNIDQSGDMFLTFESRDSNQAYFVLLDIMGHGKQAALFRDRLSGFFAGVFRSHINNASSPAHLMAVFSDSLYIGSLGERVLASCVIGALENDTIEWVAAGHPAPMLIKQNRLQVFTQDVQSLPGLSPKCEYYNCKTEIDNQSRLLLYTDGIYENHSRSLTQAHNIQSFLNESELCRALRGDLGQQGKDQELLNCLWQSSLPLLSNEVDDASMVLLGAV